VAVRSCLVAIGASCALAATAASQAPAPGSAERAIVQAVDARNGEALALLERVVNINSGTQNLAGVRSVGNIFRAELDALGFKTEWVDGAAWHRAGHLLATHPGAGPKILLIGHLDTVFEADSPFQKFERIDAKTAKGPGIIDMKGGDVVIVAALKALHAAGALKNMDVTVMMTGDEEAPGDPQSRARAALVAAAKGRDIAIGFEDGSGDPKFAVTARRGDTGWELQVTGTPAHSSQIFSAEFGPGAIFEAARILNAFREKMAGEPHLTFNPGAIVGGTAVEFDAAQSRGTAFGKTNVIAKGAIVAGDLRTLSPEQLNKARQTMQTIVAGKMPRTEATLTFDEGYPPLAPAEGHTKLLAVYDRASQDLGFGPVTAVSPDKAGAADVSFVASEVPMIIDGVGLMGRDDHTPGETADLSTMPSQTKRAAITLYRLARGSS
jgi:glutamate carboxypeptidase